MALERFIPKSPDANIRNGQDFEVAKFGHLNTIVEYINNNSAKPAGLNGYVQFNNNNALGGDAGLFWNNTTKSLSITSITSNTGSRTFAVINSLAVPSLQVFDNGDVNNYGPGNILSNTIYGTEAFRSNVSGAGNTVIGYQAGNLLTTGTDNVAIGRKSFMTATTGARNVAIGPDAMRYGIVTGNENVAIGYNSMRLAASARWNVAIGLSSLSNIVDSSEYNTAVGVRAMSSYTGSSTRNTGIGYQALPNLTTGGNNTGIGTNAGGGITTGSGNTIIGSVGSLSATLTNTVAIGDGSGNVRLYIPDTGNVLIGTTTDIGAKLGIKGSGSTSATTSLLVQNSAGSTNFQITDDGQVSIPPKNAGNISNLVINGGSLTNSTSVGIDLVSGQYASQLYIRALGATTPGFPSAILGKSLIQSPSGLVFTSNGAGALSNTDIAMYIYQSKSVHINGFTEVASAILNVDSTTKGFLLPRMTTTQRDAIATPATGLKVYNTTTNTTDTYDGATWQRFGQQTLIKGSGSTSATTSLLVQNSTSTQSMKFTDNGALRIDGVNGADYGLAYYSSGVLRFGVVGYGGVFADQLTCGDSGIIVTTSTANGLAVNTAAESSMIQTRVMSSKTYAYVAKGSSGVNQFRVYDLEGTQIGAGTKEASAYLQVDSTTAGFLPPRMTTLQRTSIASPAAGLVVFDTTLQNLCYYRDGVWVQATFTAA